MDVLKEIKVTNSYLGLDQDVRDCQHEEPYDNCTTKHYLDSLLEVCGCLPLTVRSSKFQKVHFYNQFNNLQNLYLCSLPLYIF